MWVPSDTVHSSFLSSHVQIFSSLNVWKCIIDLNCSLFFSFFCDYPTCNGTPKKVHESIKGKPPATENMATSKDFQISLKTAAGLKVQMISRHLKIYGLNCLWASPRLLMWQYIYILLLFQNITLNLTAGNKPGGQRIDTFTSNQRPKNETDIEFGTPPAIEESIRGLLCHLPLLLTWDSKTRRAGIICDWWTALGLVSYALGRFGLW